MKKFVVISHTHWDREWYMPFEAFRLKLVDLIDRLLEIIDKDKDYIFHLDAQTVVLEDYLAIKPQKEDVLKKYIKSGNIIVGPWYLQNDFFLTGGESTVRNLQVGTDLAEKFGKCSKVGYAPDQFADAAQLPQILADFGIDSFIFGRGYRFTEKDQNGNIVEKPMPSEFVWKAPDGTECLAIYLKCWYNNAQHIPEDKELANLLLDINEKNFEGFNVSPYVLLMNGVDHLEAQADVRKIIEALKADGRVIEQYSLDGYVSEVKKFYSLNKDKFSVYQGDLDKGNDGDLLKGCRSSKSYLKRENVIAEDLLINKLEPLYSLMEIKGLKGVYPTEELNYLWKQLMKNHPHDSICCCSRDEVGEHMEDNYKKIGEMCGELLKRGMKTLCLHLDNKFKDDKNYVIVALNPTEAEYTGVVEEKIFVPINEKPKTISIIDEDGKEIPYELIYKRKEPLDVFSPLNLPGTMDTVCFKVRFESGKVPPIGLREYVVKVNGKGNVIKQKSASLENDYYRFSVENGIFSLTDKKRNKVYLNPFFIEDEADKGDSYIFRKSPYKPIISDKPIVRIIEDGIFVKSVKLTFDYQCPACYDLKNDKRSGSFKTIKASLVLSLYGNEDDVRIYYNLKNECKDHRIRIGFKTGDSSETLITDGPFDYSDKRGTDCGAVTESPTLCNATFAGGKDFTLYTEGLHEVEKLGENVLLSVVRSTGYINRTWDYLPGGGEQWKVPGNQCLREFVGRFALNLGEKSPFERFVGAKQFRIGLLTSADSFDYKKYSGGRFAVQSSRLEKLYYVPDKFIGRTVSEKPIIDIKGEGIVVTALKCDEDGNAVLRTVSFADKNVKAILKSDYLICRSDMTEKSEEALGKDAEVEYRPKQIITYKLKND